MNEIWIISKRILGNISAVDMAKSLNIPLEKYVEIEEGKRQLTTNQRKAVCEKLNIISTNIDDFIKFNFKRIC